MTSASPSGSTLALAERLSPLAAGLAFGSERDLLAPLGYARSASELPPAPRVDRAPVAAALAAANQAYGHPRAAELAARLADPATRVVVTGQQPGLFGGPFHTLLKALAAARWVEELERAGQPAVALFWMATEDHDWAEVAQATLLTAEGPRTHSLGEDPEPLVPVGSRVVGDGVEAALAAFAEASGHPAYVEAWQAVARWWRPSARFGEAFARLLAHWLGPRCPLIVDAQLPQLKSAERAVLTQIVERRAELDATYAAATARVEARGYTPQVAFRPGASPLFLLEEGKRRRIEWQGEDQFALRGSSRPPRPLADLLTALADNPLLVSPGVLARPAVQDAVFGTSLQVLGPGELSYMTQVAAAYPVLGIAPPAVTLRPHALVLEARQRGWLDELGLPLEVVLGDAAELTKQLGQHPVLARVEALARQLDSDLDALRPELAAVDASLEGPWQKTRDQAVRALSTFGEKVAAAAARRDEQTRRRVDQLRHHALPGGKLQERVAASAYLVGRYGEPLLEALWRDLELASPWLQVVTVPKEAP